ncbi:uncharacterized protein LOC129740973 isoform X3 [Uranotaenia lowii]|uniref:uncharacterized protein LOC129740973 isoform X3 n=1 Tax=Uranotaenia lowii TaxID=190385 RepID=UPI00247A1CDA|nr:uncharacterized protein LOC129740973 isoform X3 [Uranotaenia lowii]
MSSNNADLLLEDGAFASSKNSWNRYYHNSVVQPLLTDLYQITMAYAYWKSGKIEDHAVFDLFFRTNPFQGEFTIFAGLEECLKFMESFHYSETDIEYLKHALPNGIEEEFFEYLSQLTAKDVTLYAIEEGSVAFPRVPLIKVMGPLIIVQLLETTLLTLVNYASLMATNAARYRMVAGRHIELLEFGLRRAQGPDGGLSASKYSYIGGFDGTSNVLAGKLFNIPVKGTHAHAYITSFTGIQELKTRVLEHKETGDKRDLLELAIQHRSQLSKILDISTDESSEGELAAMVSFAIAFPGGFMALVDTYDVKSEKKDTKSTLLGDSGCLLETSSTCGDSCYFLSGDFNHPFRPTTQDSFEDNDGDDEKDDDDDDNDFDIDREDPEDAAPQDSNDDPTSDDRQNLGLVQEPDDEDDRDPDDSSNCFYCRDRVAHESFVYDNGNLLPGIEDFANETNDGPTTTTNDDDSVPVLAAIDGERTEDQQQQQQEGVNACSNGTCGDPAVEDLNFENGNEQPTLEMGEDVMVVVEEADDIERPRCAKCEAEMRNAKACVIGHLKTVGKCFSIYFMYCMQQFTNYKINIKCSVTLFRLRFVFFFLFLDFIFFTWDA